MVQYKMSNKYRAFISYSHKDSQWGEWLHKQLEKYSIFKKHREKVGGSKTFYPVFRDRAELPSSSSLNDLILSALQNSDYMIVICSPNSTKSKYVNEEIKRFKKLYGEEKVLALIVDGEPNATTNDKFDDALEAFPKALRYEVNAEGELDEEKATEPVAADAREIGDGKERALIKIVAGLLGVGFEELWQREKRRKRRNIIFLSILVITIFSIISGLAYFSYIKKLDADEQRDKSEMARSDAEDLIAFLQNDAKATLSSLGRLDLMESLNKAVFRYLDKNRDSTSGLRYRAEAKAEYDQAVLLLEAVRTRDAKKLLLQAVKNSKTAAKLQKRDNWFDIAAVASYKYGEILYNEGKLIEATEYLDEAGQLATRVLNMDPENADALTARYGQNFILADIKAKQGLYDEALSDLFELDTWFESKRANHNDKTELDHVIIMTQISRIASDAGRHLKALESATRALQLSKNVTPGERSDRAGVVARLQLATVYEQSTNLKKSTRILEQALFTVHQRLNIESRSQEWNGLAIRISRMLASIYDRDGENVKAYKQFEEVISYAKRVQQMDITSAKHIQILLDALWDKVSFIMLKLYPDESTARANALKCILEAREFLRFAQKAKIPPVIQNGWSKQLDQLERVMKEIQANDN